MADLDFTQEQLDKIAAKLDSDIARAEAGLPAEIGDVEAYKAEKRAYESNRFVPYVQHFQQERKDEVQKIHQNRTLSDDERDKALKRVDELYNSNIDEMKEHFMAGIRKGAPDEHAKAQQQSIMDSLMQWPPDLMGVVKALLMMIPGVGDTMAAGGKWLKAKLSPDIPDIDFATAKERIKLERAYGGAAANIGIEDPQALINSGIAVYENPTAELKTRAASVNEAANIFEALQQQKVIDDARTQAEKDAAAAAEKAKTDAVAATLKNSVREAVVEAGRAAGSAGTTPDPAGNQPSGPPAKGPGPVTTETSNGEKLQADAEAAKTNVKK